MRRRPIILWMPRPPRRPHGTSPPRERMKTMLPHTPLKERPTSPPPPPATRPRWLSAREGGEPWWSALLSYALVALLGVTIVVAAGSPRPPGLLPVMARLIRVNGAESAVQRTMNSLSPAALSSRSAADWLVEGAPLIAWVEGNLPNPWQVHWHGMAQAALSTVTGTPLSSVFSLVDDAVPVLSAVRTPAASPQTIPPALLETDPHLPGDHGRVWAELGKAPLVGIYQTHSHEAFGSATATEVYSTDWPHTVVQVGWWLAQDLHSYGIGVVQSRVDNMREGVLASWALSLQTARSLLRWYPSVRILLDLHRSQLPLKDTLVNLDGQETARILLVVGTNQLLPNPHWQENMEFALKLAKELKTLAPGILRSPGVDVAPYRYNQQLLPADVLVEIGGPENTMAQERQAVAELAAALAALVRSGGVPGVKP
jgi:stage II sporulation protein P